MTQPRIVFVTTCKNRVQHIQETLPKNIKDNADYQNCKFVVLDYRDPGPLRDYIWNNHRADIDNGRLAVYHYFGKNSEEFEFGSFFSSDIRNGMAKLSESTPFKMAHAKNMAHRLGILEGADILVNLDADNFTGAGFATWIAGQFREWCPKCGGVDLVKARTLFPDLADRMICHECEDQRSYIKQNIFLRTFWEPGDFRRGVNGRIVVTRNAFLKAGGYDERYETWAPDDKDFNARLQRLGYSDKMIDRQYVEAVRHNDRTRFREYPQARSKMEEYEAEVHASKETVVNSGHFGEGVVFKNFSSEPITLGPIPTRIFGIGMHKTCTTSLCKALEILGFDAAHWNGPQWAKNIWLEMRDGRSPTVEKCYAITDLPITLLYRQLDQAYPGSKFILTVRDEQKWIESVRKHWSYDGNPWRSTWDNEPAAFTHRIHHDLYGQKNFDAEVFMARYRRHNAEVVEYFRDRPRDLLVLNMEDKRNPWWMLCSFLDVPVPDIDYPVALPY